MRFYLPALVCCVVLWLTACHRGKAPVTTAAPAPPPADNMRPVDSDARIYYDDAPAFTDSVRLTIRDPETWRTTWGQATSGQPSPPPLPVIDF